MNAEIVIAGSGGQGVLLIGRLLAEAGAMEGREVVWLPSYGAEKRGGSVSCSVTISDQQIGSLSILHPGTAVAMNQPAVEKLEPNMKQGGLLVINQSLVSSKVKREDIRTVYVQANQLASEMGNDAVANLVVLGALIAEFPVVSKSSILAVMDTMFAKNQKALEANKQAFAKGLNSSTQ
jgi:2-oxoglutarate ferredoxin oxidoreductase subunit gamma